MKIIEEIKDGINVYKRGFEAFKIKRQREMVSYGYESLHDCFYDELAKYGVYIKIVDKNDCISKAKVNENALNRRFSKILNLATVKVNDRTISLQEISNSNAHRNEITAVSLREIGESIRFESKEMAF